MKGVERSSEAGALLVVGPGAKGPGGIASVIRLHAMTDAWKRQGGHHLSTYDDRSGLHKLWSALRAYLLAPLKIARAKIVHVHLAAQTSVLRKLPIVWLAHMLRKAVILHFHAPSEDALFSQTPDWQVRFLFRSATRVVALSEIWARLMLKRMPGARIVVIANPVIAREPRIIASHSVPMVLFVGKLDARKGCSDLLHAAALVLKRIPAATFCFAGNGEVMQAKTLSRELGIAESVQLKGWMESRALEALYEQADVLALPSYAEGVPMSVIEAMSYGIPVVCTPVGGLPELIVHGENGLFIEPGAIDALSKAILCLLTDCELAAQLGAAGRETVNSRCTVEMVSYDLDVLYSEVLKTETK